MYLRATLILSLCLALAAPFAAHADAVSASRLSAVIARILSYERTLPRRAGGSIDILVVHAPRNEASQAQAGELERGLAALSRSTVQGLPMRTTVAPYASNTIETAAAAGVDVVIVCSGLDSSLASISSAARRRNLLTVGLHRQQVVAATSIAVLIENGQAKIVVNLANARAEGIQLSAQLLRLAEVL